VGLCNLCHMRSTADAFREKGEFRVIWEVVYHCSLARQSGRGRGQEGRSENSAGTTTRVIRFTRNDPKSAENELGTHPMSRLSGGLTKRKARGG